MSSISDFGSFSKRTLSRAECHEQGDGASPGSRGPAAQGPMACDALRRQQSSFTKRSKTDFGFAVSHFGFRNLQSAFGSFSKRTLEQSCFTKGTEIGALQSSFEKRRKSGSGRRGGMASEALTREQSSFRKRSKMEGTVHFLVLFLKER